MTTSKLPFELSPDAISSWLHTLSEKNSANSAVKLNNAIKLLRKNKTDTDKVLAALIQLIPAILHICNNIELSFIQTPDKDRSTQKVINLCIQLLRNTSLAFCNLSNNQNLSDDDYNLALYLALQIIGDSQRMSTKFHEPPSSTLWGETGKLYNLALKSDASQKQINHKIKSFKNQLTIDSVIKRNLVFSISAPYRYSASQVDELFSIANQVADKLNLNPAYAATNNSFQWDSLTEIAPYPIDNTAQSKQFTITINTQDLIVFMKSKGFTSKLDSQTINQLYDQLSGYQSIINNPIPSPPTISRLIVGLSKITEHLLKVDKLKKIQQFSSQSIPDQAIENMTLEPMPFEKNSLHNTPRARPSNTNMSLLENAKPVKTIQVKHDNYITAETNDFECMIGDLALFCSSNLTHKLGIIRQVRITNATGTTHILIEKTEGNPVPLSLSSSSTTDNQTVGLQHATGLSDLFMPVVKLPNGTQLSSSSGQKFSLKALTDFSPFFTRYQIES